MFSLPSVKMPILRMGYHNIGPLSVNQPVLRMTCPYRGLLSVNPVILRMGAYKNRLWVKDAFPFISAS